MLKKTCSILSGTPHIVANALCWSLCPPPWLGWPCWGICVTNDHGYVSLVVNTSRFFPHSRLITGCVTRLTRRMSLVEQELLTLPEHLSSPAVFSGVRVTRSFVWYVCFPDRCLSFFAFSFGIFCCLFLDIHFLIAPLVSSNSSCELQKIVSALIIVEGWYFLIDNHCEKVLLNSCLSFKDQGLKLRVFHGTIILVSQHILWYWLYFATAIVSISISSSYYYYYYY
jgi:hypothetical protein